MGYIDYTDLDNFVYDNELKQLLCLNNKFDDIYEYLLQDDFLAIDNKMKIPFFAVTRDYIGAREKYNFESTWIVNDNGQYYIAALLPNHQGTRMARLKWVYQ